MWEGKGAWGRPWSWPAGDTQGIVLCPDVQQRVFADVRLHWAYFDGADGVVCLPSHCPLYPAQWYGCEETSGHDHSVLCAKPWRMLCVRGFLVERPRGP